MHNNPFITKQETIKNKFMKLIQTTILFCIVLHSSNLQAQSSNEKAIHQTIIDFATAGDQHQVRALETLLDANYRIVMNQLFGSTDVHCSEISLFEKDQN